MTLMVSEVIAQKVKIGSIPYTMFFENMPSDYRVGENAISISAPGKTDLFISPDGAYSINKSPRLIFKPDSDFIFSSKIELEFRSKWDAGVLIIYNDNRHFAKFCFESDFMGQPRIVSVVCNETADDCNSMPVTGNFVFYRIIGSSKNNTFGLYYSSDGSSWFPIRSFKLDRFNNIRIGFSAQSPSGNGCTVNFSNIDLQQKKPTDIWNGI